MSTETSPAAAADSAADESHQAAAEKFFSAPPAAETPTSKPADKPADKPAAPADPLASILKSAQPAAPAAAEPAPLEDIDKGLQAPPENAKSRAGWDELKKRASEERRLRLELEQKLKTAPATTTVDEATKARLAELETQNKQFSERLKVFDLKNHPEFVTRYLQPAEQAKQAMANIAKSDEVEVNVEELLSMKGKALNSAVSEAMDKMTPYARVRFQTALDGYFTAQMGAEQALAQADEALKTMKTSGGARSRASFDEVAKSYTGTFLPAAVDEKSADADKAAAASYNDALAKLPAQAEKYAFGQIDERGAADLAHKAALYEFTMSHGIPRIASIYNSALSQRDAKIADLEKQVKALTVASPSISGGAGAPSGGDAPPANETHLQAAARYFGR
jgi:hypothetical protein